MHVDVAIWSRIKGNRIAQLIPSFNELINDFPLLLGLLILHRLKSLQHLLHIRNHFFLGYSCLGNRRSFQDRLHPSLESRELASVT